MRSRPRHPPPPHTPFFHSPPPPQPIVAAAAPAATPTPRPASPTVLLLFCIRIVSIHWHAPKPNFDECNRAGTRASGAETGGPRGGGGHLKAGRLSPIFIIHSSLNLFRFLPRSPRLREPGPINLRSVVFNELNRVSKTMWVNATAAVLFMARERHDLSSRFSFRFRSPFMPRRYR